MPIHLPAARACSLIAVCILLFAAAACAPDALAQAAPAANQCDRCGKVEAIRPLTVRDQLTPLGSTTAAATDSSPTGTPSVAMHQIGKGLTNQGQVVLGTAGGGAYTKRPSELNAKRWEVVVRMDDGEKRSVTQNYQPMLREGDRVRVTGTKLELVQ